MKRIMTMWSVLCAIIERHTIKGNFAIHNRTVHEQKRDFKCSMCDYSAGHKQGLINHIKSVHDEKPEKSLPCPECPFLPCFSSSLKKHISQVHKRDEDKLQCPLCNYRTASKKSLAIHVKIVQEKKRDYKCSLCDYAAGTFQCKGCSFGATRQCDLTRHVNHLHKICRRNGKS